MFGDWVLMSTEQLIEACEGTLKEHKITSAAA